MANTKVTGDLIASGTITADNLVSGTLDTLLNSYLTTNTYATQGYVTTAVNNLIAAAPASLDTLNELAAALNDDANFATTVTNSLATKLNLSGGNITGNLGIGISPAAKLHVSGSSIIANNAAIDPDSYTDTVVAGGIADGSGFVLRTAIGGNAGTGESWAIGAAGNDNFYMGFGDGSSANTLQTFLQVGGNRHVFLVPSGGNVGIGLDGTTSPSHKLHVENGNVGLYSDSYGNTGLLRLYGTDDAEKLQIGTVSGGGFLYSPANMGLSIFTGGSENLKIQANGNVGIGTASPRARMSFPNIVDTNGYDIGTLRFYDNGDSIFYGIGVSNAQFNLRAGATDDGFAFWAGQSHRMQIQGSTGNVGIGTTSPQAILHTSAPYPTYTDYGTVFYGGTTNNSSQNGIMLASAGNALSGVIGSNLFVNGTNWSQTNTGRSTGWLSMVNTTVAGQTSTLRYNGYVKGTNTTVERFIIDGNGRVGIGTNAPASIFHLKQDAPVLTSESTNTVSGFRINVLGGGTQLFRVQNAGTTKFQIDPNGGIYLGGSTAAANALDDYEEGTFTPTIFGSSSSGTTTYTQQNGKYTKIGNVVYITGGLIWTSATGTGSLLIGGLPFTVGNYSPYSNVTVLTKNISYTHNNVNMLPQSTTTRAYLFSYGSGQSSAIDVSMQGSGTIEFSGFYMI